MRYFLTLSLLLCSLFSFSQKKKVIDPFVKKQPVPHKAVNDFDKFLSASERDLLEKDIAEYRNSSGNSIIFISLDSLTYPKTKKQYTIEDAAQLYFNTWGIGDSVKNNGVLLMVSRHPRRVRVQVGRGLTDVLTNNDCQRIVDDLVLSFKQDSFYRGINEAVGMIMIDLAEPSISSDQAHGVTVSTEVNTVAYNSTAPFIAPAFTPMMLVGAIGFLLVIAIVVSNRTTNNSLGIGRGSTVYRSSGVDDSPMFSSNSNSDWSSDSSAAVASFSSSDSSSSSSSSDSSSSTDTSSGGSSDSGGASGSW